MGRNLSAPISPRTAIDPLQILRDVEVECVFVTRATVESHLHAAYRKLGITSRVGLAEALREYD